MVFRDVTLERRTRAALLANEKLAVAGRLAATIAHEIHNPLDSVANLLYLLHQNPASSDAKGFLELAQSELARVTQISRAMLSLYRESRAPVPIDLKETIQEVLLLLEGRFHTLRIQLASDLPAHVVVEGFPAELRQVFTNLITNAAEAAGENGSVSVRVAPQHAVRGERSEDGALIEITDNGSGIAPELRDHLFEPFFTTKGEHGTGLGLWVSQGIVHKIGGSIELVPGPDGRGAIARVFLAAKPAINPGGD
jgi:signal transduction histidine kinase